MGVCDLFIHYTSFFNKADKTRRVEKKKTKRSGGETELEVVMEAFLGFCDEYK